MPGEDEIKRYNLEKRNNDDRLTELFGEPISLEDRIEQLTGLSREERDQLADDVIEAQRFKPINKWLVFYWNKLAKMWGVRIGKFSFTLEKD